MKKLIKFLSRHPLTKEQLEDIKNLFGDNFILEQKNKVFTDIESVRAELQDCDFCIAVLPQKLALQVGFFFGSASVSGLNQEDMIFSKLVTALSVPVMADDGQTRKFVHSGFFTICGEKWVM